ncbi:HAMP domain-containing sensor histidine kinase [Caulobacter sp. S45]|uniref:sensor histidine kinase n=1 Tax=Caulobacter sp. S45 TaxID=1641861 RepID=UPI001574F8E5|nr:HAMP domain-containing sensor histidine kinase [Caulobacter sp. S45]
MRPSEVWRTTTFRLSTLYGLLFALGAIGLLGLVYLQVTSYQVRRVDGILQAQADAMARLPAAELPARIDQAIWLNGGRTSLFAVFSPNGARIAGNLPAPPLALTDHDGTIEVAPTAAFPAYMRILGRRLPSGEELVVGRDVGLAREMRVITASALLWSGALIIAMGLACGVALSIRPIRRLRRMQAVAGHIAAGDFQQRMPVSGRRDELDTVAAAVNAMIVEVERLMGEVKAATDTIAHDLRTPLTRARAQLHRLAMSPEHQPQELQQATVELDEVLERFRALLRLSELEAGQRRAAFAPVDLSALAAEVIDLHQPLAEAEGIGLTASLQSGVGVEGDAKLLFEALSNLVDNALKFTGKGGHVQVEVGLKAGRPYAAVSDDGPGVPEAERAAILNRFYRGSGSRTLPGSGLGLSIVAAIARLHRFELELEDISPGLRVSFHNHS